ncbi:sensor histidine kinase [Paractinoplanes ferrugineus]|uniref:histidine kinase n=1 Tax=Paractinoplanes ferrugineus TaxID=113564 RepID=A0A919MI70_9ACTN|nr:sensor histidine kinase [Actinoplanes ferrugineus]GIE16563.1 two-component sensor histidine kinase [Actinoplanes ferrugineus]
MSLPSPRNRPAFLVDLLVSGSVAGLAVWWWHQFRLGGLLFGGLTGLALLGRRRRPVVVFALVAALTAAFVPISVGGSALHEGMLLVALAVAMYSVVVHAERLRTGAIVGVMALLWATVLQACRTWLEWGAPPTFDSVGSVLLGSAGYGAVVWAAGLSVRTFWQQRKVAEERVRTAEREREHVTRLAVAQERARIARELHDIVAHSLSVMILQANGAEYAFEHDPRRAREALRTIGSTGRDALGEIKQLVQMLRDEGADDHDPVALDRVGAVVARARDAGLAVHLVVDGSPPDVPGGMALAVYRIVQESLTNTLKHAGPATAATVRVAYGPDRIEVDVTDTGAGVPRVVPGGHGLVGMRERVSLYGGAFDAGPRLGGGWRVRALIPLLAKAAV